MPMDMLWVRRAWKRRVATPLRVLVRPETRVEVDGDALLVDLRDTVISRYLYIEQSYEEGLRRLMRCIDLAGLVCIDVGANLGLHTVLLARLAAKVLAFEPERRNYSLLERNIVANGLRNVVAFKCAVGDREGSCQIRLSAENFGDHRVSALATDGNAEDVPMMTIDVAAQALEPGSVGFVKIDVQGYEQHVLQGAQNTIAQNPDLILVVEVSPSHLAAAGASASGLVTWLVSRGFGGVELTDDRMVPLGEAWIYEFMRKEYHVDLVLSRNRGKLASALSSYWGRQVPELGGR